jgi:hypothetical protein
MSNEKPGQKHRAHFQNSLPEFADYFSISVTLETVEPFAFRMKQRKISATVAQMPEKQDFRQVAEKKEPL